MSSLRANVGALPAGSCQPDSIADTITGLRKKGVTLWLSNGQLRYKAQKGTLSAEELEHLRVCRHQVVEFLGGSIPEFRQYPLSFSQRAHWNLYHLKERPAIRQIASATRLFGNLKIGSLYASLAAVIQHHAALRTRIVVNGSVLMQEVCQYDRPTLPLLDIAWMPERDRKEEGQNQIRQLILEPIDPSADSLVAVKLLRVGVDEHVLIVAMEHMISDAFSMTIFIRDLFLGYEQAASGLPIALPDASIQFGTYAVSQQDGLASWISKHGNYFERRFNDCQRTRFPSEISTPFPLECGWETAAVSMDLGLKAKLQEWSRRKRTTLVMAVFTAYVALVLRWCRVTDAVFLYQIDNRDSPRVQNSIGYFASVLYLRIQVRADDTFEDLLDQITQEYCRAHEHADASYAESLVPRPAYTRNTCFNWVPVVEESHPRSAQSGSLRREDVSFDHPMLKKMTRDTEPIMLLYDTKDGIVGGLLYPNDRYTNPQMSGFVGSFMRAIEVMLHAPESKVLDFSREITSAADEFR